MSDPKTIQDRTGLKNKFKKQGIKVKSFYLIPDQVRWMNLQPRANVFFFSSWCPLLKSCPHKIHCKVLFCENKTAIVAIFWQQFQSQ